MGIKLRNYSNYSLKKNISDITFDQVIEFVDKNKLLNI